MKCFYSIASTLLLCLIASITISCEDDYSDLVLFEGVEPIYQIGACDNFISSLNLYLTESEAVVLGIDGGDGNYQFVIDNPNIVTVAFAESVNGYQRIKILPASEGVANVTVRDGSGFSSKLNIKVYKTYQFNYHVTDVTFGCTSQLDDALWKKIQADLALALPMQKQGTYTLEPHKRNDSYWGGGNLYVHPSPLVEAFFTGTYEMVDDGDGKAFIRLFYNDEVHEFGYNPFNLVDTRTDPINPFTMYEDVTHLVTEPLPAGCQVYRLEKWMYEVGG